MSEFMDGNNGNGCVIILFDAAKDQPIAADVPKSLPSQGIYDLPSDMDVFDHWSNTNNPDKLVSSQAKEYGPPNAATTSNKNGDRGLFISQWLLTQQRADVVFGPSLAQMALETANQLLYTSGVNAMSPEGYPTVIMVDYLGAIYSGNVRSWDVRDPSLRTLVIGLNLYMASQNCKVSSIKNPLLQPRSPHQLQVDDHDHQPQQWNGVIFANGTRFDEPLSSPLSPSSLTNTAAGPSKENMMNNLMYPPLKPGTRFMNGTVVQPLAGIAPLDC